MTTSTRCYYCGHGTLDGFTLEWTKAGRLRHEPTVPDADDADALIDCVEDVGLAPGYGTCSLGGHAVPRDELYLAEDVRKVTDGALSAEGVIAPRRSGHVPPRHLRFGPEAWPDYDTILMDEDAEWPFGDELPSGTEGIIFEVADEKGTPFTVCRPCIDNHIDYGTPAGRLWQMAKDRPGWRRASGKASSGRASRDSAKASPDSPEGRLSALRDALAEPSSSASLAARLGVDQRTVQRLLKEVGATSSRSGKSIVWALPTSDAPTTDDTGDTSVSPDSESDDEG